MAIFSGTESHTLDMDANWTVGASIMLYISGTAINFTGDIAAGTTMQNTSGYGIYAPSMTGDFILINNGTTTSNKSNVYIPSSDVGDITIINNAGATMANTGASSEVLYFPMSGAHNVSITNAGTMTAVDEVLYLPAYTTDLVINNSGTMQVTGTDDQIMYLLPNTYNITNSGAMQVTGGSGDGLDIRRGSGTLTNTGLIKALGSGKYDIFNTSTMTLNNDQGGSDALTFSGVLPTNYNIIINSMSDYGKLAVTSGTGATTFGIHPSSTATYGHTYSSVLTGVSASKLTATSGTYSQGGITSGFTLSSSDDSAWDLVWGANVTDTKLALRKYARSIGAIFSQSIIASNYAHMNTYDCNVYGEDGACFSVGSRTTRVDDPDTNSTSGVLNFGHKLSSSWRLGAFMDQTINNSAASGIKVDNKGPMVGLMAVWNQNPDTNGLQLRLGNTYQSKDVGITREIIGSAEPGKGKTTIETQSYLAELQYRFMVNDKTMIQPYAAIRRTTVEQDGYTEEATVGTPLTFAKLEDKTSTVIAGIKTRHRLKNMTYLKGALGIEHDVSHTKHNIRASGLAGLTDESFNNAEDKNRVVATVGVDHYLSKNKVISANLHYQQLGFKSTDSTSLYLNYNIGF
ncbi:MAG: autotransporter outer membrane beta-barrel domain-containing protein [Methylophilaceae bacterium]|nr:autotransporter outer membrane beta-barrel domain-containing protein [Methylophilaceae bacterium]